MYLRLNVVEYLQNKHIPAGSTRNKNNDSRGFYNIAFFVLSSIACSSDSVSDWSAHVCRCFLCPREAESPSYPPLLSNLAFNQEAWLCRAVRTNWQLQSCVVGLWVGVLLNWPEKDEWCSCTHGAPEDTLSVISNFVWLHQHTAGKVFWSLFITWFSAFSFKHRCICISWLWWPSKILCSLMNLLHFSHYLVTSVNWISRRGCMDAQTDVFTSQVFLSRVSGTLSL